VLSAEGSDKKSSDYPSDGIVAVRPQPLAFAADQTVEAGVKTT
jgi:hypothetical protein